MSSRWKGTLALAATAALTFGSPEEASAQSYQTSIWPYQATEEVQAIPAETYPEISSELLDPGAVGNKALQKAIIDDAARGKIIGSSMFEMGLDTDAAYTLTRARNAGELPGAKDGQSPADWWRETEPKIFEKMEEYKAERALPFQVAGGIAGGFALSVLGSAAIGRYRRRKDEQQPAADLVTQRPSGPGTGP